MRSEIGGSTNPVSVIREVLKTGGIKEFYKGLDSALLRQVVYGTLRLGIYFNIMEHYKNRSEDGSTTFLQKAGAALLAGSFGSFWGNPFDLVLVQM